MISTAIEAATQAGKYLKQNLGKVKNIELKDGGEKNLVTEIDKHSEEIIISIIKKHFPSHDILAEESGKARGAKSDYRWVIDPLDGTTNFTHGFPVFCVSIGLEHCGELIAGAIYDPNFDELFTAEKGKGAFLNGKRMHVSSVESLKKSLLVTGFPYNIRENPDNAVEHFVQFLMDAQAVRRMGSAAIDMAYVAAGRYEGFWEVHLNPWDMAAGAIIVTEAGGMLSDFAGKPFSIYEKQVLATNGRIHEEMMKILENV
ncbi:MAG TPA: inositol monophosphatase family protein [Bacteroidota bacterium]|nr:inositol monophosphatase family protein [Bacteroidota bacterium]